jgi:hypothetical protein
MTLGDFEDGFSLVPPSARCFALRPGLKTPWTLHAHLEAVAKSDFLPLDNYGISLDRQWLLVDFDGEGAEVDRWVAKLPPTWMQQTRRGVHRLYAMPGGHDTTRIKNRKIIDVDGTTGRQRIVGDVKVHGYLVGPGSVVDGHVYTVLDAREPQPVPAWLLDVVADDGETELVGLTTVERDRIEIGANDDELARMAGWWRRQGFTAGAIEKMLLGIMRCGVLEQDPARGLYGPADAARIARSAASWAAGEDGLSEPLIAPAGWVWGDTMTVTQEPIKWWLTDFVPQGELVLLFGEGGVGKTTLVAWLAAQVTLAGGTVAHVGVEDPFWKFLAKVVLCGGQRERVASIPAGSRLRFPRDAAAIGEALREAGVGLLYLDSIYTHFEAQAGQNAAERARTALGPLAEVAQASGATVLGTFHERRSDGSFLGSAEMVNVCRSLIHVTRPQGRPLRAEVVKTNAPLAPDYYLEFPAKTVPWEDGGRKQLQVSDTGEVTAVTLTLPMAPTKVPLLTVQASDIEETGPSRLETVAELHSEGLTVDQIAEKLKISSRTVKRDLAKLRLQDE